MSAPHKPNILTIICDQLNARALSCYGGAVNTPNIDRLAAGGVLFRNATCPTPVCSPSRASLATGLYPHTHGITVNVAHVEGIKDGETTTDLLLNQAGYETHFYGKLHLEDKGRFPAYYPDPFRYVPEWAREMQSVFDEVCKGDPWTYMDHYNVILPVEIEPGYLEIAQAASEKWKTEATPLYYELALKMGRLKLDHRQNVDVRVSEMTRNRLGALKPDQPFSITCSIQAPHDPNVIHSPYYEMFDPGKIELPANYGAVDQRVHERGWGQPARKIVADLGEPCVREFTRVYYGAVKMIDDEVGRILYALDRTGRADDTIVIFTTDHGDMLGGHGMVTKSTDTFYDEIVRIPMIIRYPKRVKPARSDRPVCMTDVMPTLLDFTGQPIPKNVQGLSLAPHLMGRQSALDRRRFTFTERIGPNRDASRTVLPGTWTNLSIRGQGWKYVRYHDKTEQLFNLAKDPGETRNLAQDRKHVETRDWLSTEIDYWMRSTDFPIKEKD